MAYACNLRIDLKAREVTAFAWLGALRHLNLQLRGAQQIRRRDAKSSRGDLLYRTVSLITGCVWQVASRIFSAFSAIRPSAKLIHRNRKRLVGLLR